MTRTVPLRLLVTSTTLAALAGFALAYWRAQPPPYTPRAESLLFKTQVNQIIFTGPLRTFVKNPDGSTAERVMLADKNSVAPGQSGFASVAGGSASAATPSSNSQGGSATTSSSQFPINAADYKSAKDSIPSILKEASIPVDLKVTMKEKQGEATPVSLIYNVSTETVASGVNMTIALDVQRRVIGNPIAREGEKVTIRSYKTQMRTAPAGIGNQLKEGAAQLLRIFIDEWQVVQGLKNDEEETKDGQ